MSISKRSLAVAGALAFVSGCTGDREAVELDYPIHRFEPNHQTKSEDARRSAVLDGELRNTISEWAQHTAMLPRSARVPGGRVHVALTPAFEHGARALFQARWGKSRHHASVVRVAKNSRGHLEVAAALPPGSQNVTSIAVKIIELSPTPTQVVQTGTFTLPAEARVEFGLGIHPVSIGSPTIEFAVDVCSAAGCVLEFSESVIVGPKAGWMDRSVALDEYAGQEVRLRLTTEVRATSPRDAALGLWSAPVLYASAPSPSDRRNVILISLDTLSADHLNTYGYPHATAPFIDAEFGGNGVVFENAVSASTVTGASHMSLFTSALPSVHGFGARGRGVQPPLRPKLLAEALQDQGIKTAAFTENAAIYSADGFARGFDEYFEKTGRFAVPNGHAREIFSRGVTWWRQHRGKPRFLFLHTYQVHGPYRPPNGYLEMLFGENPPTTDRHRYDAEIKNADNALRDLFEMLRRDGDLENTVVIVVSDHGEEFGEHGLTGHGITLHSEMVHVPLLFTGEGVPSGLRVSAPVSHLDVMPTILELANVEAPKDLGGQSLVALWESKPTTASASRPIYSETWVPNGYRARKKLVRRAGPGLAVRVGDKKLVRYIKPTGPQTLFYDLAEDPFERKNLSKKPEFQEEIAKLGKLLDELIDPSIDIGARFRWRGNQAPIEPPLIDIAPEREARLRALGYLE